MEAISFQGQKIEWHRYHARMLRFYKITNFGAMDSLQSLDIHNKPLLYSFIEHGLMAEFKIAHPRGQVPVRSTTSQLSILSND